MYDYSSICNMYLVLTALFYINREHHVGHIYTLFIAKMLGRYLSACGKSYLIVTGTDEHGEKVHKSYIEYVMKHNKKNFSWKDYIYMRRDNFNEAFSLLDTCMVYHTDSQMHIDYVKKIFTKLQEIGVIYQGKYVGYYNLREERYVDEKEYESLSDEYKSDFIIHKEENGYYLKIDNSIKEKIIANIDKNVISKSYIEYSKNLVRNAKDLFISREINDKRVTEHSIFYEQANVYIYVWFDAILYYCALFRIYNYKLFKPVIVIGKDIQMFHVVVLFTLAYHIFGYFPFKLITHGMIQKDGKKVSKSYNNMEELKLLADKYSDLLYSYLLTKEFNNDIEVTEEGLQGYYNFLKNNVRNLYKRYFVLFNEYKSKITDLTKLSSHIIDHVDQDKIRSYFYEIYHMDIEISGNRLYEILKELSQYCNKKINDMKMWEYSKNKEEDFFIIGNFLRLMLIIESILCTPGIENIFKATNDNINSSLCMSTKMIEIKTEDIKILNLDILGSHYYRKKLQEKVQKNK